MKNNTSHSSQFYWNELDDEAENGSRSKTSEVETIEWSGELVSGAAGGMGSSRNKSGSFQNDIGLNKTLSPNALLLTASRLPETSGSKTPEFQVSFIVYWISESMTAFPFIWMSVIELVRTVGIKLNYIAYSVNYDQEQIEASKCTQCK